MKPCCNVVLVLAVFVVSSYFLLTTVSAKDSSLKQQDRASWMVNHGRLVKRDVSSNRTSGSANATQVQNLTTTGVPTVPTTFRRTSWSTRRRKTASSFPLDHLGFPMIPNSHRGTRRPRPSWSKQNASNPTVNSEKDRDGNFSHEIIGELRERENGTTSTLRSNTTTRTLTDSIEISSKIPHTDKISRSDNRRDISLIISKQSIWISVVATLFLSAFICLTVHWVRQKRRGKLMIAPAGNKGQRSTAVVFKA